MVAIVYQRSFYRTTRRFDWPSTVASCDPSCTTLKSSAVSALKAGFSTSLFHRWSIVPLMYMSELLSARDQAVALHRPEDSLHFGREPRDVASLQPRACHWRRAGVAAGGVRGGPDVAVAPARGHAERVRDLGGADASAGTRTSPESTASPAASADVHPSVRRSLRFMSKTAPESASQRERDAFHRVANDS